MLELKGIVKNSNGKLSYINGWNKS
jgi:hypothetical protein